METNAKTNIHGHIMHWRQFIYCMDSSFFYCMLSVTCLMIARFYSQHNPHCRPILILYLVQPHKHKLHPTSSRKSLLIMQIFSATRSKYPKMFVRPLRACSSVFELWSWWVNLRHKTTSLTISVRLVLLGVAQSFWDLMSGAFYDPQFHPSCSVTCWNSSNLCLWQ